MPRTRYKLGQPPEGDLPDKLTKFCPVCNRRVAKWDFWHSTIASDHLSAVCRLHLTQEDVDIRADRAREMLQKAGIDPESPIQSKPETL